MRDDASTSPAITRRRLLATAAAGAVAGAGAAAGAGTVASAATRPTAARAGTPLRTVPASSSGNALASSSGNALAFSSGNADLVADFAWARQQALAWVQTGRDPSYIPSYWAGLTNRPAFYSRDLCHQMLGAHLLGLDAENLSMLRTFAASATEPRLWYPLWAFEFDGSIYAVDYRSDTNFVREIPAVFELTQKGVEQYRWTGDRTYIDDPTLWTYYTNSVNAFVTAHDDNRNGVADEDGTGRIFQGVASYNENREQLVEAGDGIGSQYQALLAYAQAQAARRDHRGAAATARRAAALRAHFVANWWSEQAGRYIRAFDVTGAAKTDFGKENSWFMPMKQITPPGPRTEAYLDFIDASVTALPPFNIEAYTYLPETFFQWGRVEQGWKWLRYVADSRSTYPEVSYTVIGNIAEGLLGIRANAPAAALSTVPNLPAAVPWLELDHIPLGRHDIAVRHDGPASSTLTHHAGPRPLVWTARFRGRHRWARVAGHRRPVAVRTHLGQPVSEVRVLVPAGRRTTVSILT